MATQLKRRAGDRGFDDFTSPRGWERRRGGARQREAQDGSEQKLARGLGWLSIGLGLAQIGAPRAVTRLIGVPDDEDNRKTMFAIGLREITSGVGILAGRPAGWLWSRVGGDVMDLALLGKALRSDDADRTRVAAATAAVLGVTLLDLYTSQQISRTNGDGSKTRARKQHRGIHVKESVTVNRPVEEVYAFWRNFANLARFMAHLESVQVLDERRSRWRAKAPAGTTVEWEAEITEDRPNELIAWRAIESADVPNSGRVRFVPAPGGRGTEVHVELRYNPPGGAVGALIAKLFGEEPGQQVKTDLRRFKQVLETGEVVHSDASIHSGPHPARPPSPRF
ncbi:MAG: SRPBCC family protein [Gemmatimonadales bacterium]